MKKIAIIEGNWGNVFMPSNKVRRDDEDYTCVVCIVDEAGKVTTSQMFTKHADAVDYIEKERYSNR